MTTTSSCARADLDGRGARPPVPFLDLRAAYAELQPQLEEAILRATRSGRYIGGEEVEAFEEAFARHVGAACCVAVGNGLDALALALRALGIGPGDEVLVPANTFIATWLAVTACGARPLAVEPGAAGPAMDPVAAEAALTPRTRAILPVHLYGQPADLDALGALARRHGLHLLEDAAQAHGARHGPKRIGGHGQPAAWSFYPGKNLGALGDGGAITTDDPQLARQLRLLRNYGSETRYHHQCLGFNSRLDPVQAAVLRVKLGVLDEWNARRAAVADRYASGLADTGLLLPREAPGTRSAWHLYAVHHPERDRLRRQLADAGIETLIHYPVPPHLQPAFAAGGYAPGDFPRTEERARQQFSLPMGPHLPSSDVDRVIGALRGALAT